MKTKTLILFMFLAGIILLSANGCKKDVKTISTKNEVNQTDAKILKLVENFKNGLNRQSKDNELLSSDSTVWYLESTLNLTYARSDSSKNVFDSDSTFVTIPIASNNSVNKSDVDLAYFTLVNGLKSHYDKITNPVKSVILVDISISSESEQYFIVKMLSIIGTTATTKKSTTSLYPTFIPGDDWLWGRLWGKCDYSHAGLDAAEMLARYANASTILSINSYTDLETTGHIHPGDAGTGTSTNPYGGLGYQNFLLYRHEYYYPNFGDDCFSYDVMNYYLDCLKTLANSPVYRPAGKEIIIYSCHYTYMDIGSNGEDHLHYAIFTYGRPIAVPYPPINPD